MENENTDSMATKPIEEHKWLDHLVGEWTYTVEMNMGPDEPMQKGTGTESVKSLGGLWAFAENHSSMPDGTPTVSYSALGYDVSFKEYRGCWFATMSSHLWKQEGELSADGKTMTLNCTGPSMTKDGETAQYRDVIEITDRDNRVTTSYGEDDDGKFQVFMVSKYQRAK